MISKPKQAGRPVLLAAIIVVVIFVLFVCMGLGSRSDIAILLLFGWAQYLHRVLPAAEYHPAKIAMGLGYAAALVVGSHLFLKWLYRETTGGRRWRRAWTLSCAAIVLLMFVAGMAAIGIVHQTAWLVTSPVSLIKHNPSRERANRTKCASNLHQIGLAIMLYQNDHNGRYPDDLAALFEEKLSPHVFVCPSDNAEPATAATTQELRADLAQRKYCSYTYYGKGLAEPVDPNAVIAAERLDDHGGEGINVLFGDGHAEWVEHDAAVKLLAKLATTRPTTTAAAPSKR